MHINLSEFRILTGALFFMLTGSVHAGIQISPMNISLNNQDEYSGTVSVYSTSTETQYIKVTVKKLSFRGHHSKKKYQHFPEMMKDWWFHLRVLSFRHRENILSGYFR